MVISIFYWITVVAAILFLLGALYRAVFLFIPPLRRHRAHKPTEIHRIAVLISARDEEAVLPYLLDSLKKQDYPADMFRVYVVADNCTDNTAEVARLGGATVFERKNLRRIGKGYALNYLLGEIRRRFPDENSEAYVICDADNVLEENYISELNKVYCDGYPIVSGMRNSKNFKGWISSGYSVYFMYRSQYINRSRMRCGTPAFVSGTGFLVDRKLLEENGGWQFFSMSEDTEFTAHFLLEDQRIGYAESAVLYDEQPSGFRSLWAQRGRWMKGRLQTFCSYFGRLVKSFVKKPRFAHLDFLFSLFLLDALGTLFFGLAVTTSILAFVLGGFNLVAFLSRIIAIFTCTYALFFALGAYTVLSEWDSIHARPEQKLLSIVTYPIFMVLDIPLVFRSLFSRAKWVSVKHSEARSLEDVKSKLDADAPTLPAADVEEEIPAVTEEDGETAAEEAPTSEMPEGTEAE